MAIEFLPRVTTISGPFDHNFPVGVTQISAPQTGDAELRCWNGNAVPVALHGRDRKAFRSPTQFAIYVCVGHPRRRDRNRSATT